MRHTPMQRNTRRGMLLSSAATVAMLSGMAMAAPVGGETIAGQTSIITSGARTSITQSTERAIIDWRSFSSAAGESIDIEQPGRTSVLLNRVRGGEASTLLGSLTANGRVMLVNPSGVLIGASGSIDAGSFLVAGFSCFAKGPSSRLTPLGVVNIFPPPFSGGRQ